MKRLILLLTTTILLISGIPALGADTGEEAHKNQLIEDMLLYYGCHGEAAADKIEGLLGTLKEADNRQGEFWADIMDYWRYTNTDMAINANQLPQTLPKDGSLALVIMGCAINPDGSMRDELLRRLNAGLECARQYPNAYVVCTGGG